VNYGPGRSRARWRLRALGAVLAVTAAMVGAATAAQAHNVLVSTSPVDGSTVAVVPAAVTLTFDQPALALGTEVIVTGPTGPVQSGAAVLVNNTVTEHLLPGSPAGAYTVTWRASSTDSHTVSGRFSFTASSASTGNQATTTAPNPAIPAGSASSTSTAGQAPTALWFAAGAVVLLLLLVVFFIARTPRTTPDDERDPKS